MKNLFYTLYAVLFNISRLLFPLKKNRVAFVSMHNENFCDALGAVRDELKSRGGYDFVYITRQDLSLSKPLKVISFFLTQKEKKFSFMLPPSEMSRKETGKF